MELEDGSALSSSQLYRIRRLLVLGAQIQHLRFFLLLYALLMSEFRSDDHREFGMGDPTIIVAPLPDLTLMFFPCQYCFLVDIAIIGKQVYSRRVDLAINDNQSYSALCL
jgi:hypothetical protein